MPPAVAVRFGRVMSRQEVAEAANNYLWNTYRERGTLDRNYIGKLEQGKHRWPREPHREALRHVLHVALDADLGLYIIRSETSGAGGRGASDLSNVDDGEEAFDVNRREVLLGVAAPGVAALVAAVAAPFLGDLPAQRLRLGNDPTDISLRDMSARLARIRHAYQHSQYVSAGEALPSLLALIRRQRELRPASAVAAKLDAEAHQVASGLLLKSEQPILAAVAAERSMRAARNSNDELTKASSVRAVVHCLMASGNAEQAAALAAGAANQLARHADLDDPPAASVYGALLLRGAIAASRLEDHDQAESLLNEAYAAAQHLGDDRNLYWTAFGPTNVAAHRVAVAVELGDAGTAVRLARTVDIAKLVLPERRAMLLLDTARALTQWGKWDRAFATIRQAEQHAPEEVRSRPAVHAMIQELASRTTGPLRRAVHGYATSVGAAA